MFTFLRSSLFYWLPPVKSNPYGLRSRDHNFQLLACNIFSRESFIIFIIIVFFNLNRFFIVFVCFPDCQFLIYFYACSSVYFTFSTIAMPLLLSHDLHVRLFYTCCSINTQKYSLKVNGLFFWLSVQGVLTNGHTGHVPRAPGFFSFWGALNWLWWNNFFKN